MLGWRFEAFGPRYYRITAGDADEPGIDGGVGATADVPFADEQPLTVVTVQVDDLDAHLRRVQANGGTVVEPKRAIPTVGWYATCAGPDGLLFGILQPDQTAVG